ncbi:hypothetical protein Pyn_00027 [Prunus yedoensis var. nudiflora]|uniref:Uncharacterized protein n=1 Tax=Prunus yedoensis var. nudiflora TaxID=2094558 RepID=A0A314Z5G0_PRUYE|nr:hypothetical protein Pyn_00027 [Prunus yedoensis var. nudiflora]
MTIRATYALLFSSPIVTTVEVDDPINGCTLTEVTRFIKVIGLVRISFMVLNGHEDEEQGRELESIEKLEGNLKITQEFEWFYVVAADINYLKS